MRTGANWKLILLLVLSFICLFASISASAEELPKIQMEDSTSDISKQITDEVRTQVQALKDTTIKEIEAKNSVLMTYISVVLSIIGLAVAVWAALGIITAIDNRKVNKLEERYKYLAGKLEEETKLHNKFIEISKLQEKKLTKLLILSIPIAPRFVFGFILDNKLDTFITYDQINEVIKNKIPFFSKMSILMEKLESGETREKILKTLKQLIGSLEVIDTGSGYVFSIKDVELRDLYIEAAKELRQKSESET